MTDMGVGGRLQREGMRHNSLYLSFGGKRHHVPLAELTGGKAIYVYGQNEVVKDLMEARVASGRPLHYEVQNVSVHNIDSTKPSIRYTANGKREELTCDFIAGCDAFHGICRPAPGNAVRFYDKTYPFGWLGILAEAPHLRKLWFTRTTSAALLCSACARKRLHVCIFRCRSMKTSTNGRTTPSGTRC